MKFKIKKLKIKIYVSASPILFKIIIPLFLILLFNFLICPEMAFAQQKAAAQEKEVLTKGEAIQLLSATDFVKKKIGELLSWTVGYDISNVSRVKLTPTINYIRAIPKKVPPDGRTIIEIEASVDDPGGLENIIGVRADLSAIGRLSNTMLVDNGLFGDQKQADGIYTLQTSVTKNITTGPKEIPIAVANKKGWLALAKTTLEISKNPAIIEAYYRPEKPKANGKDVVTLSVKIDNPGRIEDIKTVTVDIRPLGYAELAYLRNDGQNGDAVAGDDIFTIQFVILDFVKDGEYSLRIGVSNLAGGYASTDLNMRVYK